MPEGTDLIGLGMPPALAQILGNDDSIVTCAGTSQATATLIKTTNAELVAASNQTGAILSANTPIGSPVYGYVSSSTAAVVYPPIGHSLNGTLNLGLTLAQFKSVYFFQFKKNGWSANVTA